VLPSAGPEFCDDEDHPTTATATVVKMYLSVGFALLREADDFSHDSIEYNASTASVAGSAEVGELGPLYIFAGTLSVTAEPITAGSA